MNSSMMKPLFLVLAIGAAMVPVGCGTGATSSASAPVVIQGSALKGSVYGGQQPVSGATIALYAASTSGYSAAASSLLTGTVTTNAGGGFSITGAYSCTSGQKLYIVATGGNPGGGTNANLAMMAALGDCSSLSSSTFISLNEVTTAASAFALAPFMSSITLAGTDSTNTSGLAHAFASVNKLVNIATGVGPGSSLPTGATAPTAELYTLADVLASCINSTGGTAGDGTACGKLFTLATPFGGSAPTDTIQAALNIAHYPTQNVAALYNLSSSTAPFNPQLTIAPTDWTMAVTYKAGGTLSTPGSTTVDASGNVWIANAGNNSVSVLAQTGTPVSGSPFSGNGLSAPAAVAIDAGGNAWVANKGGSSVSVFTPAGAAYSGSPFGGSGTVSAPSSIAMDATGNVWIANSGNSSVTELTSAGTYVQKITSGISTPASLSVNPK